MINKIKRSISLLSQHFSSMIFPYDMQRNLAILIFKSQSKNESYNITVHSQPNMSFIVKPLGAQLAQDHDLLGKSDPYCVITIGNQKFQTKPHSGGGKTPKWNESFKFESQNHQLKVQVYDDDIGKDDFHGEGTLDLSKWLANPGKTESDNVEIFEKKKKAGHVTIQIQYQGQAVKNIGSLNNPSNLGY